MKLDLLLANIEDATVRENFKRIQDFVENQTILDGFFEFYELTFTSAVTNYAFKHNLSFLPKDLIMTNVSDGATASFNYELTDRDRLYITTSGACVIRFLAGTFSD